MVIQTVSGLAGERAGAGSAISVQEVRWRPPCRQRVGLAGAGSFEAIAVAASQVTESVCGV